MKKIRAVILGNEIEDDHLAWVKACERYKEQLEYRVVNLTASNWLEEVQGVGHDILLAKPGALSAQHKQLYDERIYILSRLSDSLIFPSPAEIYIYENKRLLSYWLKANGIPHPATHIFYDIKEADAYAGTCILPIVAKTSTGASGSGVKILKSRKEIHKYISRTFRGKGSPQRSGPNLGKGSVMERGFHYISHPSDIMKKLSLYRMRADGRQRGLVIFQEFVPHEYEWRAVRIGNSFFAHKKIKIRDKASGTLLKNYDNPPTELLDFVRQITDKHGFYSQAIDVFDSGRGYLVNEMQCIFGQSDPFQMKVNGVPGRYIYTDNKWVFEPGDWAKNMCYDLRLGFIINEYLHRGRQ